MSASRPSSFFQGRDVDQAFIRDLADRLATRVQLTTDGHKVYLEAVEGAFGSNIDYAMLIKMYEGDSGKQAPAERRYSPAVCTGAHSRGPLLHALRFRPYP